MKRWIIVLLAAMLTILQTGAFAESDDEIRNYTRYTDYTQRIAGRWSSGSHGSGIPCLIRMWMWFPAQP